MSGRFKLVVNNRVIILSHALLLLQVFYFSAFAHADTIKIGLRAHHGIEKSMKQWQKTANYLSEKIPEHKFIMVPFVGINELMKEAEENQFDFVLTNPSSYVEMELNLGASAILTLRNKRQNKPYSSFGSVIFTRKDNKNINEIKDLKDKVFIAVSKPAFGGWRVAVRELLKEGFDVYEEAKHVSFSGGIQQDVVNIVRLGNADVGVVRTDMLERMDAAGLIKFDNFKIINKKISEDFPFARSTQLYPEWPLIKMKETSSELSKNVALALLTISSNHPAAKAGKYVGWTVPEDYQPVHNLMKDLGIGVYKHQNEHHFEHFFEEYFLQIVFSIIILIILSALAIYILITNRKLLSAKIEQDKLLNELEERVKCRTNDLLLAKEKAEEANKAKTKFLSSMSHELRTPMNAILGFAQILEYDIANKQMDLVADNVDEILVAGRHLLDLVNDVLDLAKIETGKYEVDLKKVVVAKAIKDVISLLKVLTNKSSININCEFDSKDDLSIMVDLRSFRQSLINVITNAIKYNQENGDIIISIHQQDNGFCKINITDTGEGIAEDSLKKIFEPFERVTNRTSVEGSGVGLAITKNLIEIMNGKILVESKLGEGSTFSFVFQIAE